jgi:DNA-binding beta-propeller fold protein YncE
VEFVQDGVNGVDGISNARDVVVSPDGKLVYAVGAADNGLAVFSRNATTGALTFVEAHIDNAGGVDGLSGAINVTTSPDGKHVYVSSWGRARARGVQPELDDGRSHVRGGSERWGGRR